MLKNLLSFLHGQFKALYILLAETRSEYYAVLPNKNTLICTIMWLKSLSHSFLTANIQINQGGYLSHSSTVAL